MSSSAAAKAAAASALVPQKETTAATSSGVFVDGSQGSGGAAVNAHSVQTTVKRTVT